MPEIICNTSPLQYLHQLGKLDILHELSGQIIIPPAVANELAEGAALGLNLPDPSVIHWMRIVRPLDVCGGCEPHQESAA